MMIGGEKKIGKTFLLLDLIHAIASGEKLWGTDIVAVEQVPVLYCENEVGPYELQRRVKMRYAALGENPPEEIHYVTKEPGMYLDTGQGINKLAKYIESTGARIVVLDPVSKFMIGDENSNNEVNTLFRRLDELSVQFPDLSFVLVHHFLKPPRGPEADYDSLSSYNYRGASKFSDSPDTLVTIRRLSPVSLAEWWRIKVRWEMRQAREPEEMTLAIGEGGLVRRAGGSMSPALR